MYRIDVIIGQVRKSLPYRWQGFRPAFKNYLTIWKINNSAILVKEKPNNYEITLKK